MDGAVGWGVRTPSKGQLYSYSFLLVEPLCSTLDSRALLYSTLPVARESGDLAKRLLYQGARE
eukprot:scaffold174523_cov39-Tisochrysis_lutea.AAC.1